LLFLGEGKETNHNFPNGLNISLKISFGSEKTHLGC